MASTAALGLVVLPGALEGKFQLPLHSGRGRLTSDTDGGYQNHSASDGWPLPEWTIWLGSWDSKANAIWQQERLSRHTEHLQPCLARSQEPI